MNSLPQEIIQLIVGFVDHDTRRQLLTVSRGFQVAAEGFCWSRYLSLPKSNMEEFLTMYRGHRPRLLRHVTIKVKFPQILEEPLKCRETVEELHTNHELLTRQISGLFKALKTLEERETPNARPTGICLEIKIPYEFDNEQYCDHRRYNSWRLRIVNPQTLPELSSIRTLIIGEVRFWSDFNCRYERTLDLRIVPDLISKLLALVAPIFTNAFLGLMRTLSFCILLGHGRVPGAIPGTSSARR
jgi:hypothetical protein